MAVQILFGQAAAGGTAGLGSLKLLSVRNAAADLLDYLAQRGAHGDLHQTGVPDLAAQGEYLGALGLLGTHGSKPVRSLQNNAGNVSPGFHIIQNRGLAEQALDRRERRTGPRLAAFALDRRHQRRFFAAHECAGTQTDVNVKIEPGIENIFAQQAVFPGLTDGDTQTLHSNRILGADIDIALAGTDGISGNGHSL